MSMSIEPDGVGFVGGNCLAITHGFGRSSRPLSSKIAAQGWQRGSSL